MSEASVFEAEARTSEEPETRAQYLEAIKDKNAWHEYMKPFGAQIAAELTGEFRIWGTKCSICQTEMTSFEDHMASTKHWKQLRFRLNYIFPEPPAAYDWHNVWIQLVQTPRGRFLINHLTGEHGWASQLGAPMWMGQTATTRVMTVVEPSQLAEWLWRRYIESGARELSSIPAVHRISWMCDVCETPMFDVAAHITSGRHFRHLQGRMQRFGVEGPADIDSPGLPWQQTFTAARVSFNHLSGELTPL